MRYELDGREYDLSPWELDGMVRVDVAERATFLLPDGSLMAGPTLAHARRFFRRDNNDLVRNRPFASGNWLIPGLQPWGTIPMLGGNPKAGKSTLAVDYVASLLTPGRQFLNHFAPADLTLDPRNESLYVWLINAENPSAAYEAALIDAGVDLSNVFLNLIHLDEYGGAGIFDVTDPVMFDDWARLMIECHECDGTDFWSPSVVIVDGLTAILADTGRGPDDYGIWGASFQKLLRASDVPNGLVVAHNTLKGGHLMGGVQAQAGWDGLWNYWSTNPDNPSSPRFFNAIPRMGGVAVPDSRVTVDAGRLNLVPGRAPKSPSVGEPERPDQDAYLLGALEEAGEVGMRATDLTGSGRVGKLRREALTRLEASGQVRKISEGKGHRWFLDQSA